MEHQEKSRNKSGKKEKKREPKRRMMWYNIIVQNWMFALGAVFGAEKASQTAPFVVL